MKYVYVPDSGINHEESVPFVFIEKRGLCAAWKRAIKKCGPGGELFWKAPPPEDGDGYDSMTHPSGLEGDPSFASGRVFFLGT